jgi:hypothetical protein
MCGGAKMDGWMVEEEFAGKWEASAGVPLLGYVIF